MTLCIADLSNENGLAAAGLQLAVTVCKDVLWPVLDHTPHEMRQVLFERFLSGLTGAMVAELGLERAKQVLDAVKLAAQDVAAERARAN